MSWSPKFGWEHHRAARYAPSPIIGSPAPDAIGLGRYANWETGEIGARLRYGGQTGVIVLGRNGGGKDTRLLMPLLFQTKKISIFAVDVKGEMSAVCGPWRRHLAELEGGKYISINPYGLHANLPDYSDLVSDGFDPLNTLDPTDKDFSTSCSYIADAIIESKESDSGNARHFIESAKAMLHASIMWEVICARREKRRATMANVRKLICTPSFHRGGKDYGWPRSRQGNERGRQYRAV